LLGNAKITDVATLERLLGNAKITDVATLERLLGLVDDGGRLERLLAMADDAAQLENFLTKAGGASQAANLENLMTLAGGAGKAPRLTQLLNIANGNAAKFQELVEWTTRLSSRSSSVPAIAPPPEVSLYGFSGANMPHMLDGHTWEFLNIPSRLNKNTTLWPPGTSPTTIQAALGEALRNLNPPGGPQLPSPGSPLPTTAAGRNVQVGSRTPPTPPVIGQFFPLSQPGLVTIVKQEMRAIWEILKP